MGERDFYFPEIKQPDITRNPDAIIKVVFEGDIISEEEAIGEFSKMICRKCGNIVSPSMMTTDGVCVDCSKQEGCGFCDGRQFISINDDAGAIGIDEGSVMTVWSRCGADILGDMEIQYCPKCGKKLEWTGDIKDYEEREYEFLHWDVRE